MKFNGFKDFLEIVQTHHFWAGGEEDQPAAVDPDPFMSKKPMPKDVMGVPLLSHPGFRAQDRQQIIKDAPKVEERLNKSTGHLGVHWLVIYMEPPSGMPETPQAKSLGAMKKLGGANWSQYKDYSHNKSNELLTQFMAQHQTNPSNTIVYVKPTSRVDTLDEWQQMHNIGHAVWGQARKDLKKFIGMLRSTIEKLQQRVAGDKGSPPTAWEMITVMARLLDLRSYQRIFTAKTGQFEDPHFRLHTAFNTFMEGMFEMIAAYLRNGKISLHPRGEMHPREFDVPDRRGQMTPNAEIQRKFHPRDWVWASMQASPEAWEEASQGLSSIVEGAILECTWAKVGGPIYSTSGYITTQP